MTQFADCTFIDFRVTRLNFAVNSKFAGDQARAQVRTEFKLHHETQQNRLKVLLSISFDDTTAPFSIHLEGAGLFELNRPFNGAELENLCNSHCSMVMFPYLREIVADISRRAGFPPLHIPQVDFTQVFNHQNIEPNIHTLH